LDRAADVLDAHPRMALLAGRMLAGRMLAGRMLADDIGGSTR
jgi:hypothetical protein